MRKNYALIFSSSFRRHYSTSAEHTERITGKVTLWNTSKRYGFVRANSADYFVYFRDIQSQPQVLTKGSFVEFLPSSIAGKRRALNVSSTIPIHRKKETSDSDPWFWKKVFPGPATATIETPLGGLFGDNSYTDEKMASVALRDVDFDFHADFKGKELEFFDASELQAFFHETRY